MGAGNALAVLRQYGRAKGISPRAMTVLTFMALQTHDRDAEPTFYGGRRRIAAGCMGADIDLTDEASQLSKTDANRVSECLGSLCAAGAITQVRAGAARKATGRNRDFAISAAYRLNISVDARQFVLTQLSSQKTRPENPGAYQDETPGLSGRVPVVRTWDSRACASETRPESPGTQRSTSEEFKAEEAARPRAAEPPRPAAPRPPSPRCPEHEHNPTDKPCRSCGDARRARDQWEADRARRLDEAPRCRTHRGQLAATCGPCRSERLGVA